MTKFGGTLGYPTRRTAPSSAERNRAAAAQTCMRRADKAPMSLRKAKTRTSDDKPRRPTLLCAHLAKVLPLSGRPRQHQGLLEEISRTGAVVSLECPLRKGTNVRIDCRTCELRGKVVGCEHLPDGYFAEVAFPEDQPWAAAEFKPDGLFNPKFLVCKNPGCTPECDGTCGGITDDSS